MQLNPKRPFSARLMLIVVGMFLQVEFPATGAAQDNAPMELTLSQAIDLALKQNRSLKLAQLTVVDSELKKKIARSDYFPQIKNESTAFHVTEIQQLVIPRGSLGFGLPPETAVIGQGALTAYTSGTGLQQPLTQMFKIHEDNRAATADINSARIKVKQAENDIALKVRQLYYEILIAQLKETGETGSGRGTAQAPGEHELRRTGERSRGRGFREPRGTTRSETNYPRAKPAGPRSNVWA